MKKIFFIILLATISNSINSQTFSSVGLVDGGVLALQNDSINNILYAGGNFVYINGKLVNYVAKWDGTTWTNLGNGLGGAVTALAIYKGELYAGGYFTSADNKPAKYIAKWNGTNWDSIGSGLNDKVNVLCVYNNELYAVVANGMFAKWNGTVWTSVTSTTNITSLYVHKNKLYVGGFFTTIGNIAANNIASWDGTKWNKLADGVDNGVRSLTIYNNELYVGGDFTKAGNVSVQYIAKWNDSTWSALAAGIGPNGSVISFGVYNGNLFLGGGFTTVGNIASKLLAKWDGISYSSMGGANNVVLAFASYLKELYVGGSFTTIGGVAVNNIARWNDGIRVGINENNFPEGFILNQNRPNPFTNKTEIDYYIPSDISNAHLKIYDNLGKELKTLLLMQGYNTIELNIGNLAGGAYTYCLVVNGSVVDKKTMLYIK